MAEALNISRMCTATGALAISRRAFLEAAIYTSKRTAFGQTLNHFPMVRQTLLDMTTDIEAGWALAVQMIRVMDQCHTYGEETEERSILLRLLLAMAKLRLSEKGVEHAKAALELHGGNGYIEEYVTPRLLRDAQVNTVWEGPSNIMALEILKTMGREGKRTGGRSSIILEEIWETLDGVNLPELSDAVQCVQEQIPELYKDAKYLLQSDPLTQNGFARRLADRLIDVYSAAHLLEEANYARETTGSSRLVKVAEYFVDRTFRPEIFDIRSGYLPSQELFAEVVGDQGGCPTRTG